MTPQRVIEALRAATDARRNAPGGCCDRSCPLCSEASAILDEDPPDEAGDRPMTTLRFYAHALHGAAGARLFLRKRRADLAAAERVAALLNEAAEALDEHGVLDDLVAHQAKEAAARFAHVLADARDFAAEAERLIVAEHVRRADSDASSAGTVA